MLAGAARVHDTLAGAHLCVRRGRGRLHSCAELLRGRVGGVALQRRARRRRLRRRHRGLHLGHRLLRARSAMAVTASKARAVGPVHINMGMEA